MKCFRISILISINHCNNSTTNSVLNIYVHKYLAKNSIFTAKGYTYKYKHKDLTLRTLSSCVI